MGYHNRNMEDSGVDSNLNCGGLAQLLSRNFSSHYSK